MNLSILYRTVGKSDIRQFHGRIAPLAWARRLRARAARAAWAPRAIGGRRGAALFQFHFLAGLQISLRGLFRGLRASPHQQVQMAQAFLGLQKEQRPG